MKLGLGLTLPRKRGPISSFDPAAAAFFEAAGVTDPVQKAAVNTLVLAGRRNGWWAKMLALYPLLGNSATCDSFNLIDTTEYQITWGGTVTHDANGITGDGNTGFGDTGFDSFANGVCGAAYVRNAAIGSGYDVAFYAGAAGGDGVGIFSTNGPNWQLLYGGNRFINAFTALGLLAFNAPISGGSGTASTSYTNGVVTDTDGPGFVQPSTNFCLLDSIGFGGVGSANIAFASIMTNAMTDADQAALYADVQAFQTALGRQV